MSVWLKSPENIWTMTCLPCWLSFCTDFPMEKYDQKLPHLTWDKRPTANKELEQPKSELVHNVLQTSDGRRQYQKFELLSIFSGVCDNQPQEQWDNQPQPTSWQTFYLKANSNQSLWHFNNCLIFKWPITFKLFIQKQHQQ